MEEAQYAFLAQRKCSIPDLESRFGIRLFVRSMNGSYATQLHEGDEIEISTRAIPHAKGMSFIQEMRTTEGKSVYTLQLDTVCVTEDGQSASLPDEVRKSLEN